MWGNVILSSFLAKNVTRCKHQQPPEIQREGRSREESESGEDAELISIHYQPVIGMLDFFLVVLN